LERGGEKTGTSVTGDLKRGGQRELDFRKGNVGTWGERERNCDAEEALYGGGEGGD